MPVGYGQKGTGTAHMYDQVYSVAVLLLERHYHEEWQHGSQRSSFSFRRRGQTMASEVSVVVLPLPLEQCCSVLLPISDIDQLECDALHRQMLASAKDL